jgi:hypothetical protein
LEELEYALDKINNPKALGDASLQLMQVVSQRLGEISTPSTAEKGVVIREILREAFERLRISGTRTDSAPE